MSPLTPTKVADIPEGPENTSGTKKAKRSKDPRTLRPAADHPVARIAVDMPLAHLDRPFDYLVPERLGAQARPGVRVRVRFAGQLTDGFVLDRVESSEHQGRLSYLERGVSCEQVLAPAPRRRRGPRRRPPGPARPRPVVQVPGGPGLPRRGRGGPPRPGRLDGA